MICKIGAYEPFAISYFVSSTILIFETMLMLPGTYSIAVSYNGADFTPAIPLVVSEAVNATLCHPSIASVRGGTFVSVIGNNFLVFSRLMCVFGDVLVSSTWINSTAIVCKTPESVLPGSVSFSIYYPGGQRQSTEMTFYFHGKFLVLVSLETHELMALTLFCSCTRNIEDCTFSHSKRWSRLYNRFGKPFSGGC
jgi:hypothetical protein